MAPASTIRTADVSARRRSRRPPPPAPRPTAATAIPVASGSTVPPSAAEAALACPEHRRRAVADLELGEDGREVVADGLRRQVQRLGDRRSAVPGGQQV